MPLPGQKEGPALRPSPRDVLAVAALAAAYLLLGKAGLALASVHPSATAVWAPTGLAIAALLVGGKRLWPGVFVGAFLTNATNFGTLATSLGIATGNTLEALVGALLVERLAHGARAFDGARDTFKFAGLAGLVAPVVSASVGVTTLALAGAAPWSGFGAIWTTWYLGDAAGALVAGPLVVLGARGRPRLEGRLGEASLLAAVLFAAGVAVFWVLPVWRLEFLALPPVVVAAYRFGPRGAAAATGLLALVALGGTLQGRGPFAGGPEPLLLLQAFMGVTSVTGLALGALAAERARGDEAVRRARDELELRVADRTESLSGALDALGKREAMLSHAQRLGNLGSWEWDVATNRVMWSDQLYRIYGLHPREFGASFEAYLGLVHPEDRANTQRVIQDALGSGRPFVFDERIVRPGGEVRHLHSVGEVVLGRDGRPLRMFGVCHDITEQRAAEEARRAAYEQGAENRRLQELNAMKTDFINAAAHELNTPLTPIKLQLHLLRDRLAGEPAARTLVILERNVDRMALLVQDMLDVARLQSGRLRLQRGPVEVGALLEDAVATFEDLAREQRVALVVRVPQPVTLEGDAARLSQVLFNLLSNALKFTPPGGEVTLEAGREGEEAVVRVRDTGIGLTEEQMGRLFHPFSQAHEPGPTQRAGTGLGLYISRGIVEQHGGTLTVASAGPGQGATFTARLPLLAPRAEAPAAPART